IGIVSGGFFYKRLKDFIFPFTYEEERQIGFAGEGKGPIFDTFDVIQPLNGESADLYGFEVAFQNQFTFLPKPLDGLGVYANYTYVNSEATLPGGRTAELPGQAQNVANVSVSYERFGFSGRLSLHYRDLYLSEVSDDPLEDIFVDGHSQLDFTMSQRITKNVRVFAEFLNLTNEPFRAYQGIATRPVQEEYYRWWATFGIKLDW
ncbi:MAG: TonB-dependent receptor, partial [Aridibacter famidurans]|nr:TonB-dependent receptor [Aridibacter famidurans]